jgi:16S rRNA (cytosine1402-N4)-methyltransferase
VSCCPVVLLNLTGQVAGVLADLGVSSVQLDTPERGFSFQRDGPLDMRMNPNQEQQQTTTAADLVNNMSEMSLVQLFQNYGDVSIKESKRVARLICQKRPLHTTLELVQAILGEKNKGKHFKKSPATKFFQALRIAVNNELDELDSLLQTVPKVLCDGGAFVVISFHSLEDRRVKVCFKELSKCRTGNYELITKKAKVAQKEETGVNPRSRSSRLRVLKKKVRRERRARKVVVVDVKVKKGATGKKGSIQ